MAEHTPGPWGLGGETIDDMIPVRRYDTVLALVFSWPGSSEAEARANANIIATAPDLLAACKAIRRALRSEFVRMEAQLPGQIEFGEAAALVDAAIRKAEGTEEEVPS